MFYSKRINYFKKIVNSPKKTISLPFVMLFTVLILILINVYFFLASRPKTVKTSEVALPTNILRVRPTLPAAQQTYTFDEIDNWVTYSNDVFSVEMPKQIIFEDIEYNNPSHMIFSWAEPKNDTPEVSIMINLGYYIDIDLDKSFKYIPCTNKDFYKKTLTSFSVDGNYEEIVNEINKQNTKGLEKVAADVYWLKFPICHESKEFDIDIQIRPSYMGKELRPLINQVLTTIKFTE